MPDCTRGAKLNNSMQGLRKAVEKFDSADVLKRLSQGGFNVNEGDAKNDNVTLLHMAVKYAGDCSDSEQELEMRAAIVAALCGAKADPGRVESDEGSTALLYAAKEGVPSLLAPMLQHPNIRDSINLPNKKALTPLGACLKTQTKPRFTLCLRQVVARGWCAP